MYIKLLVCLYVFMCTLVKCDLNKEKEEEVEECEWEGVQGKCVSPRVCITSLDARGKKQPVCSHKGDETLICCTDCNLINDTRNVVISPTGGLLWKDGRISRDKCLDYLAQLPHKCSQEGYYGGISRIMKERKKCHEYSLWAVGGAPPEGVNPSENPYEALMGFGHDVESAAWLTAGTIVSDKFILTSAQFHRTMEGRIPLKFAALGVKNRTDDKKKWQIHHVKKIHRHPQYDDMNTDYNDIALLELETSITFNTNILPACLPDPSADIDTKEGKVSSWKEKGMNFNTTRDTANIIKVQELTAKQCDEQITEEEYPIPIFYQRFLPRGIDGAIQTCYGNKDICMHIYGSPVVVNSYLSRCMNTVTGVQTYGHGCGTVVYTRVAHYVAWIEGIVWP